VEAEVDGRPTSTVDLNWQGGFRFTSSDAHGHSVTVDAPQNDGDEFEGFMPGELLLTSLAGCSGIDVVSILLKQRQQVTGLQIKVKGMQAPERPWAWEDVELEYIITGKGLLLKSVKRAIDLSEDKYCSIGATIEGKTKVRSTFKIIEDGT
jgi:putative redox protein